MEQTTAQWIGIGISAGLGATALIWNVLKHLSDRRQADRQRAVDRAEIIEIKDWSFVTDVQHGVYGCLTIRNSGVRDVYVESVCLVCEPSLLPDGTKPKWDTTSVPLQPLGKSAEPLKPGEARQYLLRLFAELELASSIKQRKCWIQVNSHSGEIGRLGGEEVAPIVEILLEHGQPRKAG